MLMIEIYICWCFFSFESIPPAPKILQFKVSFFFLPTFSTAETENERKSSTDTQAKYSNECNEFHTQRSHDKFGDADGCCVGFRVEAAAQVTFENT